MNEPMLRRTPIWGSPAAAGFWVVALVLSAYFYYDNAIAYLFGYRSERFGSTLLTNQIWFVVHIIGTSFALWLGPIQFSPGVRQRYPKFHRTSGRFYVIGSIAAGLSAIRLGAIYDCQGCRVSLITLAVVWLSFTVLAYLAARAKTFAVHRQLMMRSYTCAFAFVTIRVVAELPTKDWLSFISVSEARRKTLEWACWVVPLLFVEIFLIQLPAIRASARNGT